MENYQFETPWTTMRGVLYYFFPVAIILFVIFSIMANKEYKNIKSYEI